MYNYIYFDSYTRFNYFYIFRLKKLIKIIYIRYFNFPIVLSFSLIVLRYPLLDKFYECRELSLSWMNSYDIISIRSLYLVFFSIWYFWWFIKSSSDILCTFMSSYNKSSFKVLGLFYWLSVNHQQVFLLFFLYRRF